MKLIKEIVEAQEEHTRWRRDLHTYPELGFEETRTANFVANQLESWGIEVTRGVGKTGVVGTLKIGSSNKAIGFRADMDALPMDETNDFAHKSKNPGCKHGCGHDGHTVMLLAAARYLAQSKNIDGTVHFIFQPAEEANPYGSGAQAMMDDGLFKRFHIDNVFAMHNLPEYYLGVLACAPGLRAASVDLFEVTIKGIGGHGAEPHDSNDPIMIATQMLSAWQTIISRNVNSMERAVFSACSIQAGNSWNVIPETVVIKGNIRTLSPTVRELVKTRFHALTENIAEAFGAMVDIRYQYSLPCGINDPEQTAFARGVMEEIFESNCILSDYPAGMASEDFALMRDARPGCYVLLGTATPPEDTDPFKDKNINDDDTSFICKNAVLLHQPNYDFNDEAIPVGATVFARLAEKYLD